MFETWDDAKIQEIMEVAKRVTSYLKRKNAEGKQREMMHQFIWIDDFGSDEKVSRRSETLKALAQRGRHYYLSILPCIVQKTVSLHPAVRSQCSWIACVEVWLFCAEVCTCSRDCSCLCCLTMMHVLAWTVVSSLRFTHGAAHPRMWPRGRERSTSSKAT